ncbi:hypothetical protein LCI18_011797 [Fusarium solani-melongenae]|uniref:Uncharacterized protein n=1 Tax=Fusarium solani subsp. cucurbitae TaxID=2747967 RepID=A0ACD3ZI00_FUSSC|nr:hypothetical protein LCI18_011797 [Fusarium solani-melongenae]
MSQGPSSACGRPPRACVSMPRIANYAGHSSAKQHLRDIHVIFDGIESSHLFKLPPFKALTADKAALVEIVKRLLVDIKNGTSSMIVIGDTQLRWNSASADWISFRNALEEATTNIGVIIGLDMRFDATRRRPLIDRDSHFDKKGKENNPALGKTYSDDDLLRFITQIYPVLMTRGIRGMYVYACDIGLREYLKGLIPFHS